MIICLGVGTWLPGDSGWTLGNTSSPREWSVLEWAALGGGGFTVPGGVPEAFGCYTEGHGLVGNTGDRSTVGLDYLGGLFQPW